MDSPSTNRFSYSIGLRQLTVRSAVDSYVQTLGKPELLDLVARSEAMDVDGVEDLRPTKKAVVYGEVRLAEVLVTAALFEIDECRTNCMSDLVHDLMTAQSYVRNHSWST